jgi:hypothetical protein
MTTIKYTINGQDFKTYGVYVSEGSGILDRLKMKEPASVDWPDYHGKIIDLQAKRFEARTITLKCFIKAGGEIDFISKLKTFLDLFNAPGTQRLQLEIDTTVLPFEVYCGDSITITKKWRPILMTGEFTLKLTEPEPVKRVIKFSGPGTLNIALSTAQSITLYWGDGTKDTDIYGEETTLSHNYSNAGTYYPIIAGIIEEITNFSTNGTITWIRL